METRVGVGVNVGIGAVTEVEVASVRLKLALQTELSFMPLLLTAVDAACHFNLIQTCC